ncbi:phosphotransferase family enzyme [Streptomyces sp. 1114.5]|uniref:phosphotransferase n=1 Tax=Streptomyces sp. 1114.5 TaxID=1938830 RepID=UPI000EABF791|nr:phosphotransferase [Streptomyces sp. 1114.5]RKT08936.1 phosphotransferase family enzyme [Streptomyces sp. 1114.5]
MQSTSSRTVTVDLTHGDEYFGQLGPFGVDSPWWSSVAEVVARATEAAGVPVLVARLVEGHGGTPGSGGRVRYHAEALERPGGLDPRVPDGDTAARLGPAERRAAWATPGGLREALAWAESALARAGRPQAGPARQIRTWNLSGLFRLPVAGGADAWLKTTTPAFNAAEGAVIRLFADADPTLVPTVLAADPAAGRLLLDHVPGEDGWGPSAETVAEVVPRLVAAQAALADGRAAAAGLRDRTPGALLAGLAALADRLPEETDLSAGERAAVRALIAELPAQIAELVARGLPETALHGDFHPGNWRSDGSRPATVIDFADACLGHPALDGLRPRAYLSPEAWQHHTEVWAQAWRRHAPGSDPLRALELAEPLYHLSYALRYQEFLDHIEPSERPYHAGDPAAELRAALACAGARGRA